MATDSLQIVRSPFITDIALPLPVHFNGLDQPVLDNYVQTSGGIASSVLSPIVTLTGTTPTINGIANTRLFEIVMTGNTTYSIINVQKGQVILVRVKQGSGTTYVNTWFSTVTWVTTGGTAPVQTTTSNGITEYGFICRGLAIYDGFLLGSS